jgi:cytidylate kinase
MEAQANLDHCLAFVNSQAQSATRALSAEKPLSHPRAVTVSRQAGCGALVVAEKLARHLQAASPQGSAPWTVFDRNLMERVLEDHHLPGRLAKFLPEDRMTELQDIMDELFGLRPPSWTVVQQTAESILQLAQLGNAILIGRGATMVTAKLPDVFHVRLVAPLEKRVEHAHEFYNMSKPKARKFCVDEDRGRKRYLRKYYGADVDDPLLYHLIVNTGMVSYDEAARLIAEAALGKSEVKLKRDGFGDLLRPSRSGGMAGVESHCFSTAA